MKDKVERKMTNRNLRHWTVNLFRFYYQKGVQAALNNRNPNLWVFSAWEGMKYSDNAKYLYEYVTTSRPEIECVWITKNNDVFLKLHERGCKVCLVGSDEAKRVQKRAGVAIYTHGLDDFGDFPYIFGAKLICLWHGAPVIKKNYSTRAMHDNKILDFLTNVKAYLFSYIYRDLTIATSEYAARNFRKESLTRKKILVIGQPRNDILSETDIGVRKVFSKQMRDTYCLSDEYVYISYMPTYRGSGSSQKFLEKLIKEIIDDSELNDFLKTNRIKLLVKMHYLTDITGMRPKGNIIFLDDRDIECTQYLLALSQLLITDYSSCSVDFALKGKEILFFAPDLETYDRENGLYQEFLSIIRPYRISTVRELFQKIKKSKVINYKSTGVTYEINKMYNENIDQVGKYNKIVTDCIIDTFWKVV